MTQSPAGVYARKIAAEAVEACLRERTALEVKSNDKNLSSQDLALAQAIAQTTMRHLGECRKHLNFHLRKPLAPNLTLLHALLETATAQILFMQLPPYAIINTTVELIAKNRKISGFKNLTNAILRNIANENRLDGKVILPKWLHQRWEKRFSNKTYDAIRQTLGYEAYIDVNFTKPEKVWPINDNKIALPNGAIRLSTKENVTNLPNYEDGTWWIQDFAATLPVHLLGDIKGKSVLDCCAAPGGKTTQLLVKGANVTSIEQSEHRLQRLRQNLNRLNLGANLHCTDIFDYSPDEKFDAIVLDAPCSALGTLRRHPEIAWIRNVSDIQARAERQLAMLDHCATMLKSGGTLMYAVCSTEPEEGIEVINTFLKSNRTFSQSRIKAKEIYKRGTAITPEGNLLTHPALLPQTPENLSGMDGFFISRLHKR